MGSYNVILTCRNSEKSIESSILTLSSQSIKPQCIVVVDDGSTDRTPTILADLRSRTKNMYVITNPDLGYDIGRVVLNWNKALELTRELKLEPTDYHMISTLYKIRVTVL